MAAQSYSLILSDPPWKFEAYSDKGMGRSPKYALLTPKEIIKLPVSAIAAKDSAYLCWCSWPYLRFALAHFEHNGFTYKTGAFTWTKDKPSGKEHIGGGYYTRSNPEFLLLATKGKGLPRISKGVREWVHSPVREHSRKPEEVYTRIEALFGDVPRVELFARPPVPPGWDATGLEYDGKDIREYLGVK